MGLYGNGLLGGLLIEEVGRNLIIGDGSLLIIV